MEALAQVPCGSPVLSFIFMVLFLKLLNCHRPVGVVAEPSASHTQAAT